MEGVYDGRGLPDRFYGLVIFVPAQRNINISNDFAGIFRKIPNARFKEELFSREQ
ncbi:MAG: hypothetical protein P4L49_03090 [Desulfosporosinus sp.]|nr:hypothetical protein [Desulfosporosinus sp.]